MLRRFEHLDSQLILLMLYTMKKQRKTNTFTSVWCLFAWLVGFAHSWTRRCEEYWTADVKHTGHFSFLIFLQLSVISDTAGYHSFPEASFLCSVISVPASYLPLCLFSNSLPGFFLSPIIDVDIRLPLNPLFSSTLRVSLTFLCLKFPTLFNRLQHVNPRLLGFCHVSVVQTCQIHYLTTILYFLVPHLEEG